MKNLFTKNALILCLLTLSKISFAVDTGIDPEYLKLKVSKFAVSKSQYCTNPIVVFEKDTADQTWEDFLQNPTLGSGTLENGVYECVILEFEDLIKFAAFENSDMGNCSAGIEITNEICRSDLADQILHIDGTSSVCSDGVQTVALYLSTGSTNDPAAQNAGSPFLPPQAGQTGYGFPIQNPLVVASGVTAKFIVDGMGQVEDNGSNCEMKPPIFNFSAN